MSNHSLFLGGLDLIGDGFDSFKIETIAEGMSFGGADPQDVVTQTLLQDGSSVATDRWDNREIAFGVLISGPDLIAVAAGEAALYAELGRRNTLTWTPPDGWGPPTVFDVLTSWAEFDFDDWGEMEPGTIGRRFAIRLTCLPWGRDVEPTVVAAVANGEPPPPPVTVVLDDCSSTASWSNINASLSVVGGTAIQATWTAGKQAAGMQRSFASIDASATPYLVVDWQPASGPAVPIIVGDVNGSFAQVASGPSPLGPTMTRTWFEAPATIVGVVVQWVLASRLAGSARVYSIERTNVGPFVGTGRQQFRSLVVGGSARTQGSLQVAHETSALGDTLIYTNAEDGSGYQASCSRYEIVAGTPDSSTVSGRVSPIDGAGKTYDVPARAVPYGSYAIMAKVKMRTGSATPLITVTGTTRNGGLDSSVRSTADFFSLTTAWSVISIGRLTLPPTAVPSGSSAVVRLKATASAAVDIDELWIFNMDIGALTWVKAGSGAPATFGASNRIWLDTATLDRPKPSIWLGTLADGSDRRHALGIGECEAPGTHIFTPGPVNLLTVTTGAENAAASLEYFKSYANNAGG